MEAAREILVVVQLRASLEYLRHSRNMPGMRVSMGTHRMSPVWSNVSASRMVRRELICKGTHAIRLRKQNQHDCLRRPATRKKWTLMTDIGTRQRIGFDV